MALRYLAPSGAPIHGTDLFSWAVAAAGSHDVHASLRTRIRSRFDVQQAFLMSTGRAGLTVMLRALQRLVPAERNEVIVPAYTCYSVAAAVIKSGLRVRVVDISPETLDYRIDSLENEDFSRVLAIIATNLYGFPSDLPRLSRLAHGRGVFLVDDAAQAMGASIEGRSCGTWGEVGLFSFDKGKNVAAIDGGVILAQSTRAAEAIEVELRALPAAAARTAAVNVAKTLVYFSMLRPSLYGLLQNIPQLGLGRYCVFNRLP